MRGVFCFYSLWYNHQRKTKIFCLTPPSYTEQLKESETTLQDVMAKFRIEGQISSSLSIFPSGNCNLQILILRNKHSVGCLRKAYSWPSNKGSCFWEFLVFERKSIYRKENAGSQGSRQYLLLLPTEVDGSSESRDPTLNPQWQ